ncbi:2-oxoglutarate dehydrogenase E1 subunit family protein, partial [Cellulomonas carbonis]
MSQKAHPDAAAQFGANQWLVDELYDQYLKDRDAVDPAWWDFFEDYRPGEGNGASTGAPGAPAARPAPAQGAPTQTSAKAPQGDGQGATSARASGAATQQ